ncbi:hypothetical protein PR048_027956 [Dryococelus australis]|uniref:DUF4371 domain-containing protein n=1 Tax=Dryococelus australis TaxID=614101 RepID=A0ABQ9GI08_9NEOP|nr:hypothetical protein PR048_027956 [Dryococelus australis]
MLKITSHEILRSIVDTIKMRGEFALIVDETSDITGKEQVSINIRSVDHETFYMMSFSLDALLRLDLNLDKLRGQRYDDGVNMAGAKSTAVLDFLDTLAYDRSDIGPNARGLLDQFSQG